ncbi:hypothetical protein BC827DRAFT_1159086 [Russula dissimulans]|nr:hypothetical protein BC827DRAFT_1159086 [Russula dissimulans]
MASTTSSPGFQSILDAAFDGYTKQTGIDLAKHPSAEELQSCHSPDAVLQLLQERENAFKDYRGGHRRLINWLRPVVQVIHAFSGVLGEISVMPVVPLQPTKAIFVGIDVLLMASISVTEGYDALMDLFECIGSFLSRLRVYVEKIPFSHTSAVIMVKIMVEVLSVLALATKQIKQGRLSLRKETLGRARNRRRAAEVRPIDAGRGSNDNNSDA